MGRITVRILHAVLCIAVLGAPAWADPDKKEWGKKRAESSGNGPEKKHKPKTDRRGRGSEPYDWWSGLKIRPLGGRFDVPPGHRPPPGMCRLWYPDLPPGKQPPPERCDNLQRKLDAYIVYGEHGYDPRYDWRMERDEAALRALPHVLIDILLDQR